MLTRFASTYFLATPIGTKKSSSVSMAGEDQDKFKVDPEDVIDAPYNNIPKKQRQTLEPISKSLK